LHCLLDCVCVCKCVSVYIFTYASKLCCRLTYATITSSMSRRL